MTRVPMTMHELRVIEGEHKGAVVAMEPGVPLTVGTDWDNEMVLPFAEEAGPLRLVLTLDMSTDGPSLRVEVLQGDVRACDRGWSTGDTLRLLPAQPLRCGAAALDLWTCGLVRDPDLEASLPTEVEVASPSGGSRVAPASLRSGKVWLRRGTVAALVVATASLGMLALASAVAPAGPRPEQQARHAQALLHARGFTGLSVRVDDAGLVVTGHLDLLSQRSQLERILQAGGVRARLQLGVNEQLVAAVREVYRLHGVVAEVHAVGPGEVAVKTMHADAATVARVQAVVQRDVAGLRELRADNQAPPRHPSPVPVVDDPGKRVAALVPGDTAHVVTADGTRYFEGALLPTGHRIVSIAGNTVQLERDGQASTLQF